MDRAPETPLESPSNLEHHLRSLLARTSRGSRLPSLRQMAADLQVHHSTLSRVVDQFISRGAIIRQGYRLIKADTDPARDRPKEMLHLISHDPKLFELVLRQASPFGFQPQEQFAETHDRIIPLLMETARTSHKPILVQYGRIPIHIARSVAERGVPMVSLGRPNGITDCVTMDNYRRIHIAIQWLTHLNHQRIGFLFPDNATLYEEDYYSTSAAMQEHQIDASYLYVEPQDPEAFPHFLDGVFQSKERPSALVCRSGPQAMMVYRWADQSGYRIPHDFSLIALRSAGIPARAAVTCVTHSQAKMVRYALMLLHGRLCGGERSSQEQPDILRVPPEVTDRGSTGPPPPALQTAPAPKSRWLLPDLSSSPRQERLSLTKALLDAPYRGTRHRCPFFQIDLAPFVNRGTSTRHGWFGDNTLRHLVRGLWKIHGVPFRILQENESCRQSIIMLQSARARTRNRIELPQSVTIPVQARLESLFILHGCGYARTNHRFASYVIRYVNGRTRTIPVVSLGMEPLGQHHQDSTIRKALVQDWWPTFPQFSHPEAKAVPITQDHDPLRYERYLYTFRWKNPMPETEVRSLTVRTEHPDDDPTLALLAVTAAAFTK